MVERLWLFAHPLGRFKGPAAAEDRQTREQPLHIGREEWVAPIERGSQAPMAGIGPRLPAGQELEGRLLGSPLSGTHEACPYGRSPVLGRHEACPSEPREHLRGSK